MNKPEDLAKQIEIIKIGDGAGVVLPPEILERLQLAVGDVLSVGQLPEGLSLTAGDPEFDRQMSSARSIMKRYRNALSELAK